MRRNIPGLIKAVPSAVQTFAPPAPAPSAREIERVLDYIGIAMNDDAFAAVAFLFFGNAEFGEAPPTQESIVSRVFVKLGIEMPGNQEYNYLDRLMGIAVKAFCEKLSRGELTL